MNIKNNIVEMLESHDKDCVYLAVSMIRNSNELKDCDKLLNKVSLFDRIRNYSDVCRELNIKELIEIDFNFLPIEQRIKMLSFYRIQNIIKLFNQDWILNWSDINQKKYYPWFEKKSSGWVCYGSYGYYSYSYAGVGLFKSEEISNFCGKLFLEDYINIMEK